MTSGGYSNSDIVIDLADGSGGDLDAEKGCHDFADPSCG